MLIGVVALLLFIVQMIIDVVRVCESVVLAGWTWRAQASGCIPRGRPRTVGTAVAQVPQVPTLVYRHADMVIVDRSAQRFRGLLAWPGRFALQLQSAVCKSAACSLQSHSPLPLACCPSCLPPPASRPPSCQPACLPCPCLLSSSTGPSVLVLSSRQANHPVEFLPVLPILFLPVTLFLSSHPSPVLQLRLVQPSFLRSAPTPTTYLYLTFPIAFPFRPFVLSSHTAPDDHLPYPSPLLTIIHDGHQPAKNSQVESSQSSLPRANYEYGQSASIHTNTIRPSSKHSIHRTARLRSTLSTATSGSLW